MLASSLDSSILFKYTIDMDTTQYAQITPNTYMKLFFPDIFAAIQGGSTTAAWAERFSGAGCDGGCEGNEG
jgi:hypothetical protein